MTVYVGSVWNAHHLHESRVLVDPHQHAVGDTYLAGAESLEFGTERFGRSESRDQNAEVEPLPYTPPPAGMFLDVKTLPS